MTELLTIKKTMRISVADGRTFDLDLTKFQDHPVGYTGDPAKHAWFLGKVLAISTGGFTDPDKSTPSKLVFIPTSQITLIEVEFIEAKPLLNIVD